MKKSCGVCYFYVPTDEKKKSGNCFLKPPAVQMAPVDTAPNASGILRGEQPGMRMLPVSIRPFVQQDHFCGEWQPVPGTNPLEKGH